MNNQMGLPIDQPKRLPLRQMSDPVMVLIRTCFRSCHQIRVSISYDLIVVEVACKQSRCDKKASLLFN